MITMEEVHIAPIEETQQRQETVPGEQTSVIRWVQRQDNECQNIYKALKQGIKLYTHLTKYINAHQFTIDEHIIYFTAQQKKVPFVPAALRQRLLYEYHCGTYAAHLGCKKVLSALKRKYFWLAMHNNIYKYV